MNGPLVLTDVAVKVRVVPDRRRDLVQVFDVASSDIGAAEGSKLVVDADQLVGSRQMHRHVDI